MHRHGSRIRLVGWLLLAPLLLILAPRATLGDARSRPTREMALRQTMHKLWEDRAAWIRPLIVSTMSDLGGRMQSLMRRHVNLMLDEAVDQHLGRYAESIQDHDKLREQSLEVADVLRDGILDQFPRRL